MGTSVTALNVPFGHDPVEVGTPEARSILMPNEEPSELAKRDDKVPSRIVALGASLTWGLLSASGNGYRKSPAQMGQLGRQHGVPNRVYAGGVTQKGSGEHDGIYQHRSQEMGGIEEIFSGYDRGQWFFAKLYIREREDFINWFNTPDDKALYGTWKNRGRSRKPHERHFGREGDYKFSMRVWKEVGSGGTKPRVDGNRYCNMMGHDNGMEDYVRIRDLHLTDWGREGACDIVWTNPDNNNRVQLWRNRIKETGDFNCEYHANPAPELSCPERRGIGILDVPIQFADISGNGKGDSLCIEPGGRVSGYAHDDAGGWDYIDQFKYSEGKDPAHLQFVDVNGDGKADMIYTNKFNGDGTVWYNRGREDVRGSRYRWDLVGVKYQGAVAGHCTYFPDLDGDGHADMHAVTHSLVNTVETWFNRRGLSDVQGDDGPLADPHLPAMPGGDDPNQRDDSPVPDPNEPSKWDITAGHYLNACEEMEEPEKEGRTTSSGCIGFHPLDEPIPWEKWSASLGAAPGKCSCDNPALSWTGDNFLEIIPINAHVGCFMLMSTLKWLLNLAMDAIPGPDRAFSADVSRTCLVPDDIKQVYEYLNAASGAVAALEQPKNTRKGSGKKGDEGNSIR
ncbi:hypothetical protein DL771_005535 [Monosporascus sp. 5C6A]|nr:hypothetical protein DL771_005535 [Monosporascus sp. 5C6A]